MMDGVEVPMPDAIAEQTPLVPAPGTPGGPATQLSPLEFDARFTPAEAMALASAAMQVPAVLRWYMLAMGASYIDLTDERTIVGVQSLVAAGLLRPSRAVEILTP